MNDENFAAFFVLLAFIELSFTVTSLTVETNSNKRETRALAEQKPERLYELFCRSSFEWIHTPVFQLQNFL